MHYIEYLTKEGRKFWVLPKDADSEWEATKIAKEKKIKRDTLIIAPIWLKSKKDGTVEVFTTRGPIGSKLVQAVMKEKLWREWRR